MRPGPAQIIRDGQQWHQLQRLAAAGRERMAKGLMPTAAQLDALERIAAYGPPIAKGRVQC